MNSLFKEKNEKHTLFLYAFILFISAFLILLITLLSQEKYNNSEDANKRLENESITFETNLVKARQKIVLLEDEINGLSNEIENKDIIIDDLNNKLNEKDIYLEKYNNIFLLLYNKKYSECRNILLDINCILKEDNKIVIYNSILNECNQNLAKEVFNKGTIEYKAKKYSDAINSFKKVREYIAEGYTYDVSYAYLLVCYNKLGMKKEFDELYLYIQNNNPGVLKYNLVKNMLDL